MRKLRMVLVAVAAAVIVSVLVIGAVALTADNMVPDPACLFADGDPGGGQGGGGG